LVQYTWQTQRVGTKISLSSCLFFCWDEWPCWRQ
jgi:hypothetical protein